MSNDKGAIVTLQPMRRRMPDFGTNVFMSHSDEDIEYGLPANLYRALTRQIMPRIHTSTRQKLIALGHDDYYSQAIEESWISIVILSDTFLSSESCLNELVKILKYRIKMNQMVYPIYFNLDPSDVRGVCDQAMAKLQQRDPQILHKWNSALTQLADFPSFIHRSGRNQNGLIERVVASVKNSLFRYDVFISCSEDTSNTFTGNLYNALQQKKIKTFFINDKKWKSGDRISPAFRKAIDESRVFIVVLSKEYAYSTWCLDELSYIMFCKKRFNQVVLPIFYKVDPSHVRKQKGHYGNALVAHQSRFKENSPELQLWKSTLLEVANLTGMPLQTGYEYKFIQTIVESVVQSLSNYDVVMNFCGEDTRYSFAGYLYNALRVEGFKTFMDDEKFENGNQISQTFTKVIENTKHFIIIFSENYGYSPWCLDELVENYNYRGEDHLIWPIFHNVDILDVRYQRKSYGDAMFAHERKFGKNSDRVQTWKRVLFEVTYVGGYTKPRRCKDNYVKTEQESELVKHILEHLSFNDTGVKSMQDRDRIMSTSGFILQCRKG